MGIQILPSLGDSIAPSVGQIADSVSKLINPDLEFQRAIQGAIVRDPSVLKKLAEADVDNPGLLERLGLPALSGGTVPIEKEFERRNREKIISAKETELAAGTAGTKYTLEQIQNASNAIAADPSLKWDQALKLITGETGADRTIKGEAAKQAPLATREAERNAQLSEAAFPTQLDITRSISELLKSGPQVTLDAFRNGQFDNMQMAAIASSPLMKALQIQQDAYADQIRLEIAKSGGSNDAMARLLETQAFNLFMKTKGGTKEAAFEYLTNPNALGKGADLEKRDPKTLSPEETAFLAIYQTQKRQSAAERAETVLKSNHGILAALEGYREASKKDKGTGERDIAVSNLNSEFVIRANQTGGPLYTAENVKDDGGYFGFARDKLVYKNAAGVEVPETEALNGTGPVIDAELAPFVQAYNALQDDSTRAATIKEMTNAYAKDDPEFLAKYLSAIKPPQK